GFYQQGICKKCNAGKCEKEGFQPIYYLEKINERN
ncbi:MAG: hypothetical protein K0Q99_1017, partial [Clostridia bacterium]|nr:hypothetical protein [Clostridia bacterium]